MGKRVRTVGEVESPVSSMNAGVGGSVLEGNAGGETGLASKHTVYLICLWDIQAGRWGSGEKT